MTKHTPGPWRYSPAHKDIVSMSSVGRDDLICDVRGSQHGSVLPSEANANLIVAAPKMLQAIDLSIDLIAKNSPKTAMMILEEVAAEAKGKTE